MLDVHVSSVELQSSNSQLLDDMVPSLLKRNSDKLLHLNNLFANKLMWKKPWRLAGCS